MLRFAAFNGLLALGALVHFIARAPRLVDAALPLFGRFFLFDSSWPEAVLICNPEVAHEHRLH